MSRIAVRVARTELRRTLRNVVSNRTKLLVYGLLALFVFAPMLLFGSLVFSTAGERLAAGEVDAGALEAVPGVTTGVIAVGTIFLTVIATARTVTTVGDVDQPAHLLVSTSVRNAATGLVLREAAFFLLWLGVPVLVFSGALAYGGAVPLAPLFAVGTVLVVVAVAVPVGFLVGLCVRHLLTVYEPIARFRTPLVVALSALYFLGIGLGWIDTIAAYLFELLGDSPLGWPGQLLLIGVPELPYSLWQAVAGVLGGAAVGFVALAAGVRVAARHWFADPVRIEAETQTADSPDRLAGLLAGAVSQPVRTVTVTAVRRTKRAPIRLAYVAYPLFGAFVFLEELVQTGQLPTYGAVFLALYVVWASGATFTLNVLGDHGPAMASVLTSTVRGRTVVAGTVLASVLAALPLAVTVAPVAWFVSPLTATETVTLTAGTVVGVGVAPLLAAGIGSWFPRFGSVKVTNNREAVMPSKTAFLVYSLAIALPVGAGFVLGFDSVAKLLAGSLSGLVSVLPAVEVTISEAVIVGVAWPVLLAGIAAPLLSVRYAISRFDSYRPY